MSAMSGNYRNVYVLCIDGSEGFCVTSQLWQLFT